MSNLVTIATFLFPPQASAPAALLEANGIYCFIKDEITAQSGLVPNAVGGVKLQVWEEDVSCINYTYPIYSAFWSAVSK